MANFKEFVLDLSKVCALSNDEGEQSNTKTTTQEKGPEEINNKHKNKDQVDDLRKVIKKLRISKRNKSNR